MSLVRVASLITRFQGGAGLQVLTGALALDPAVYDTTIVEGRPSGPGGLAGRATMAGLEVIRAAELRRLVQILRAGRYDVVHTHGHPYNALGGVLGRIAALRAGVPRIVHTWHGPPDQRHPYLPPRPARIGLERAVALRTDAFLAVGSQTASRVLALGLAPAERISVCRPVVDPAGFGGGTTWAQARRRLDLPLGVRVVGGVGRLSLEKGPDVFLRALAGLPADVMGLWAGEGPLRDRLVRRTGQLGLADRVHWLGHRDDLAEVLPAFDVMAVPSRAGGLPAVLLEAVGAGIPVVATAVGAHRDVVVARETGLLVAPDRPGALASAAGWLLEHPDAARRMAVKARTMLGADDRYSARALGEVLDGAYHAGAQS